MKSYDELKAECERFAKEMEVYATNYDMLIKALQIIYLQSSNFDGEHDIAEEVLTKLNAIPNLR